MGRARLYLKYTWHQEQYPTGGSSKKNKKNPWTFFYDDMASQGIGRGPVGWGRAGFVDPVSYSIGCDQWPSLNVFKKHIMLQEL